MTGSVNKARRDETMEDKNKGITNERKNTERLRGSSDGTERNRG